ncbi:ATP-binding protein [Chloroflexota bacterium]
MTDYLIIPLVLVAFCLVLLVVLIASGLQHIARRPFALFLTCMGLWGAFIFLMRSSSDLAVAFFWDKFVFFAILSAAIFFYRFAVTFTGTRESKKLLYSLYFFYVLFMILIPTGLIISGMQLMWYGKAPIRGLLFFPYVIFVYVPLVLGLRMLVRHYRRTRILDERTRASYLASGVIIMFIGGTTDFLPGLGIHIYPLGIIANIIFCLLATVAMLRYGLLEFPVVLRRGAAFGLMALFGVGIVAIITVVISATFGNVGLNGILLTAGVVLLAFAPVAQPVGSKVQRLVDMWFYGSRYKHLQALESFSREAKDIVDLGGLASSLLTGVASGTQSNSVYLLLPSPETGRFVTYSRYGRDGEGEISFSTNSLITQVMKYQDSLLDTYDIDVIPSLRAISSEDRQTLMENKIELLVPLKAKERLTGMLLLSSKTSGSPYSTDDRHLLEAVSNQAAVALENARLYEELKQQLISSSKLASLGELAAYVAHEVNNGLQSVVNYGTLLRQGMADDDPRGGDIKIIETEALRARNIVETLLGIARSETAEKGVIDINDLLRSVVTLVQLRAKTAAITVAENYSDYVIQVEGNSEQLRQVFLNLFNNAIDAMPQGGKIEVATTTRDNKDAIIAITDTGKGIPSNVIDKIFDPLVTTKSKGSGLGLTVSLSIIRDHGGTISVESEDNKGSKFTVALPKIEQSGE